MDCSPPGSSVHGISQKEYRGGLLFPSPGDLPNPGIKPACPALAGGFYTTEPPVKPFNVMVKMKCCGIALDMVLDTLSNHNRALQLVAPQETV